MRYLEPRSLPEALEALSEHGEEAKVLAGGQSLLLMLHSRLIHPAVMLALQRLTELSGIAYQSTEGLRLGAMTTQRMIETSPLVRQHCPMLAHASSLIASVHVRSLGTLGGNLCHNLPGADSPPALIALDATVSLASRRGARQLAVAELFRGFMDTVIEPDELLTEIVIPASSLGRRAVYLKHCVRDVDPALVGVAVSLTPADDHIRCADVRIGIGGVSATPYRALSAEKILRGQRLDGSSIAAAAAAASDDCDPITDAHGSARYRQKMLAVFMRRALTAAWKQDNQNDL
ncbi:MAG: xanthine dehydrogenase family protein subunit M [Deltaproteobacteria bacterium]|nr:xanthine dehydrogenase family protein subunit M [Deltaproteobacteria bacterium]